MFALADTATKQRERGSRTQRLEARISAEQKEMFARAAALNGRSVTDFVVSSVHEAATRVIEQHEILTLTARDSEIFANALLNPPKPNAALMRAAKRYRAATAR